MADDSQQIGPVQSWALAAGGMVGGGIYISLSVVIDASGSWAWLSFLLAGIAATVTAFNYARLTTHYHRAGGAFDFLEEIQRKGWAGSLSWLLILGYVLTISVYAYAFGNYIGHAFGAGPLIKRALILAILAIMIFLNLAGAGKLTRVEVVIVAANLIILVLLGFAGVADWDVAALSKGIEERSAPAAFVGAAAIFVAYEGFQLLTYEYDKMDKPDNWFVPVMTSAAAVVVVIYVVVCLGVTMLVGADVIKQNTGVSLAVAGEARFGFVGLLLITLAAAFATSAAINSTLFSTAKLAGRVADDGELPKWFAYRNSQDIPSRAVILFGVCAGCMAMAGSLSTLVEAASLVFVITFGLVNLIAFYHLKDYKIASWIAVFMCTIIGLVLTWRLLIQQPVPLAVLAIFAAAICILRPRILKWTNG